MPFAQNNPGGFARAVKRMTGIDAFHVHRTRHTYAMDWLAHGGSLAALQEVANRAAHEVKDALNGVSLNLEVTRSRARSGADGGSLAAFTDAAAEQLELVSERVDALLSLARTPRPGVDVAATLGSLARLLLPAAKSDNIPLRIVGYERPAPTAAPAVATRLALASGLLALIKEGGGRCVLASEKGETVVRFSHESAGTCSLGDDTVSAIAAHAIRTNRSGSDLLIIFPA